MRSRTPRLLVSVIGLSGTFVQIATGSKNTRVRPVDGTVAFLVPTASVSKIESTSDGRLPVTKDIVSQKRAYHGEELLIIVRSGRHNSRCCQIGGTESFLVSNGDLSGHYEVVPAAAETEADLDAVENDAAVESTTEI